MLRTARAVARPVAVATLTAAVAAGIGACGRADTTPGAGHQAWSRLCDAAAAARQGDESQARAAFVDAHQQLHTLADQLNETDRETSARLLEAKQRVEADLDAGKAALATDLAGLVSVTHRAVEATGETLPSSCGSES